MIELANVERIAAYGLAVRSDRVMLPKIVRSQHRCSTPRRKSWTTFSAACDLR
ncbi:MAG TPA: hypothetical protein VIR00_07355 [Micromonosporaceae bacterium]